MNKTNNKAVIYLRVSTKKQDPLNELKDCKRFCEARNFSYIIKRENISAYKDINRPVYQEIYELARKGEVNHIVVWALDRWTRKGGIKLLDDMNRLAVFGCQIHSVQEGFIEDFNMPGEIGIHLRNFVLGILGWQGKQESKLKSERVKASKKFQRAKKESRIGRKQKEVDVGRIVELKNQGLSFGEISKKLDLPKSLVYRRFKKVYENS